MNTPRHTLGTVLAALSLWCGACGESDAAAPTEYGFETVDLGGSGEGREPRPRSNTQFLRAVYADVLGRSLENYEFELLVNGELLASVPVDERALLNAALDSISDVAPMRSVLITALLNSRGIDIPERGEVDDPEAFITEQFRRFLGREPGVYELRAFREAWDEDDAVTPRAIMRALLESREYQSY